MAMRPDDKVLAKAVFEHATRMLSACDRLRGARLLDNPKDAQIILPMLVLQAFSIELFLKSLLLLEGVQPAKTHDLAKLFGMLQPKSKNAIIKKWDSGPRPRIEPWAHAAGLPADLPNALVRCSDSFQEMRYAFEDFDRVVFYLDGLPRLLLELIAEAEVNWVVWGE